MMCTMPYSFKVLWAPFVELYYLPFLGKRKSWVVPCQLIISVILFYLAYTIEDMLVTKQLTKLTGILILNMFIITCQDIAVDSWAVEILHPENSSYQSVSQSVGQRLGMILSTTVFIALNSPEFCNKWVNKTPSEVPLVSLSEFILWWAILQFVITIYILVFVPEKKYSSVESAIDEEEEELEIYPSQSLAIIWDIMSNPNLQKYLVFMFFTCGTFSID